MRKHLILITLLLLTALTSFGQGGYQGRPMSVREFLKLSSKDTSLCVLTGVVQKVRSSTSGSFYLEDATGTVLIYGIADAERPELSFRQLDIVPGDTVTVRGRYSVYNGTTIEMKDGRLVAKSDGPDHNLSFMDRLDRQPSFKGKTGDEALQAFAAWVAQHIEYPKEAREEGLQGRVLVKFVVGRNGKVQEVQVEKGLHPLLDAEAVRVVQSSPKWKPAKMDGDPVRITYHLPVVFRPQ